MKDWLASFLTANILIPTIVQLGLAVVAFWYAWETRWSRKASNAFGEQAVASLQAQVKSLQDQVARLEQQLTSSMDQSLTEISNYHNWKLLEFKLQGHSIPPVLPPWKELSSDEAWVWRVLHCTHLNLLLLAYNDHKRRIMSEEQWASWAIKGKFLFSNVCSNEPEYHEGRKQLAAILRKEEGYPDGFRQWLIDKSIITSDLVRDLQK
jgi:hypothetical protein